MPQIRNQDGTETGNRDITIEGYSQLLKDIESILRQGLSKAYKAVDNLRVQTYWQIGERIVREEINQKRAGYGEEIVKTLSVDLNIHERTLYRILKFYKIYPILTTVLSELSWSHYLVLIDVKDDQNRKFYEARTVKESWSVRELEKRIAEKEYEKAFGVSKKTASRELSDMAKKSIFEKKGVTGKGTSYDLRVKGDIRGHKGVKRCRLMEIWLWRHKAGNMKG